ncbi:MAG: hypothetical protein EOP53_06055 [Sphingobacteriales bacterium]|nr:MAG: hypothetical protein EOP53_06055 [Sphingobacteriales bacterium]
MNKIVFFLLMTGMLFSCNINNSKTIETAEAETEKPDFFPVTNYIKGQIIEIKSSGVNPLKITTAAGKIDSVWLKFEEIDSAFTAFLTPQIDSANMFPYFKESKFLDQTIAAFTFTYEPKKEIPAGIMLKRWDVYINPQNEKVKRIYIEKNTADNKEMQLSWQSRGSSKMVLIATDGAGKQSIEKEELIKWNFDEEEL